jgi:hypothetical protein
MIDWVFKNMGTPLPVSWALKVFFTLVLILQFMAIWVLFAWISMIEKEILTLQGGFRMH